MRTKTNVKAGAIVRNHNETLLGGLSVRTSLKGGIIRKPVGNHNETLRGGNRGTRARSRV